ncbi:beta-lactamase [Mytilinidion resinicola]|uniref:Beta-lactamase n=1 Tax=Mytilinidion resinicola TaxID=574789 RepID=A0A6A6Y1S7_9PEZI|nr:beta-lactamase [Mytilinidion resinicola]KAF2802732.1 beta-lactamase [Mytilinidion resinicola]
MSLNASLLDSILEKHVSVDRTLTNKIQAAAFVVIEENGDTLYANAVGSLTLEEDAPPFSLDSVCWVASMTKLYTAVAVMQLVEKGAIDLDDDVGKLIPELSNKDILKGFQKDKTPILRKSTKPITLRHLLTHSSGFCYDYFNRNIKKWSASVGRKIDYRLNTIESFNYPLLFEPGKGWEYGIGLDWAGRILEILSDCTLEEYMQRNIFESLGISSSTFYISDHPELASRRAGIGFRSSPNEPLTSRAEPAPSNLPLARGGNGIYTTPNDYAKLLGALINTDNGILEPESLEEFFKPQLANPKHLQIFSDGPMHDSVFPEFPMKMAINHGLGGAVNMEDVPGKRRKGSMTWSGATGSRWFIDLETGIAAVMFTQVFPFGDHVVSQLYDELESALYRSLRGE